MHLWMKKFQLVIFILFYDVLSFHPSLRLINQVRFNFFLFQQNPLSERQNFLCFWQKVKYTFCVLTIPAIFVGALRSGEKQVKKNCQNERPRLSLLFTNQDKK